MTNDFRFKQFTVRQHRSAMKVGTDGVLLGAWAAVDPCGGRILDIGTGTGLVALMLAQRTAGTETRIEAVEIDRESAGEAADNFVRSPWSERLSVTRGDVCGMGHPGLYNIIVSNPPYFSGSLRNPDPRRSGARHNYTLPFDRLAAFIGSSLAPGGTFSVILPSQAEAEFIAHCSRARLGPSRITHVHTVPGGPARRSLMEFRAGAERIPVQGSLVIEKYGRHGYSEEYIALTRDFYLAF